MRRLPSHNIWIALPSAPVAGASHARHGYYNGPDRDGTTAYVLTLLRRQDIKASFFVTGQQLSLPGARVLAERAHAEGHWIGNHTFSHSVMFGDSDDLGLPDREIGRTQELIGGLSHPGRLFRPFGAGGNLSKSLLSAEAVSYLVAGRYSCVLWNSVPRDWEGDAEWVERCMEDIHRHTWTVVVMHDLPTGAMHYLAALIDRIRNSGAEIVQGFPDSCVPIKGGKVLGDLSRYTKKSTSTP
jgi:peptidoglycan-N-acetylglucosamine deacetylase